MIRKPRSGGVFAVLEPIRGLLGWRATYTKTNPNDAVGVRSAVDELGERSQLLGGPHLGAADAAQIDHVLARSLQRRILERSALVKSATMAMVAGVEAVLGHKLLESEAFTRHGSKSTNELGESFAL
jgi:hypothetical protein